MRDPDELSHLEDDIIHSDHLDPEKVWATLRGSANFPVGRVISGILWERDDHCGTGF